MSQKKRGGLGRGLSALIPQGQQEDVPKSPSSPLDVFFAGNVSRETISDSGDEGASQDESKVEGKSKTHSKSLAQHSTKTQGKANTQGKAKDSRSQSQISNSSSGEKAGKRSAVQSSSRPSTGVPVDSRDQNTKNRSIKSVREDGSSLSSAARALLSAPPRSRKKGKQGGRSRDSQNIVAAENKNGIVSRETIVSTTSRESVAVENDNGQYGPVLYRMVDDIANSNAQDASSENSTRESLTVPDSEVLPVASKESAIEAEYIEDLNPVPGATFGEVPVWSIVANREQPRTEFAESELQELVQSVTEVGVLQPIVVRPLSPEDQELLYTERLDRARKRELFRYHNGESLVAEQDEAARHNGDLEQLLSVSDVKQIGQPRYELIMGERRLRASRIAGLETIPTIVRRTENQDVLRDALLENLHRVQLNPIEEAAAYQQLMDDFACTQEVLAKKVARSRPQIANMLRLLKLPAEIQKRVAAGTLSMGHARAILGLKGADAQIHLATRVIRENLSVRATELIVSQGNPYAAASGKKRAKAQNIDLPDDLRSYVSTLGDTLDTCVKVQLGKKKCKIVIDAADRDDLERLMRLLNR